MAIHVWFPPLGTFFTRTFFRWAFPNPPHHFPRFAHCKIRVLGTTQFEVVSDKWPGVGSSAPNAPMSIRKFKEGFLGQDQCGGQNWQKVRKPWWFELCFRVGIGLGWSEVGPCVGTVFIHLEIFRVSNLFEGTPQQGSIGCVQSSCDHVVPTPHRWSVSC